MEDEPGVRGALPDAAVGDGVLALVQAGLGVELRELLDEPNVKNYDGSWTEYGSLVGVPVALGDEAGDA